MKKNNFKDYFSGQSDNYQDYRPGYPEELFEYLSVNSAAHDLAWDCATGNGQAAISLAGYFDKVIATDASESQINHAIRHSNVEYKVMSAEKAEIEDHSIDLIVVAQALHWFDADIFFKEAKRVLKKDGLIAIWSYNLLTINPQIDSVINNFYTNIVGQYWPAERKLLEDNYKNIRFPFVEMNSPPFMMGVDWSLDHLLGYLGTWSAVTQYKQLTGKDPVAEIYGDLLQLWQNPEKIIHISWPLNLKIGRF